ncbi:MAG: glycosyltransferase family 4 protein [Alphaproteobacteria bacterium]|nr:glycosyltransferase family 4 protein [Alphaproteobacteria bacterium]
MKHILVVAPDFPFPPNHGGRVDVWSRLNLLKKMGFTIDLMASVKEPPLKEDISIVKGIVDNLFVLSRGWALSGMFGINPNQVANRSAFSRHKLEANYDIVLIEGSPCGAVLQNSTLKARNIVLRVHNDESLYFRKLSASTNHPIKALYYFIESLRFALYERTLSQKLEHFLFISKEELSRFMHTFHDKHTAFLPPTPPNITRRQKVTKKLTNRVLFIGSLFMPNNRDGLEWYMGCVHPLLRKTCEYQFVVAGNPKGMSLDWLTKGPYGDEIELHVSPPYLDSIYEGADIFVNPMRFGAGMKIKTIEALCRGLPMVSTTTGIEGIGLEDGIHIFQADTPELFAKRITELLNNQDRGRELVNNAITYIETEFNTQKKLENFLNQVLDGVPTISPYSL